MVDSWQNKPGRFYEHLQEVMAYIQTFDRDIGAKSRAIDKLVNELSIATNSDQVMGNVANMGEIISLDNPHLTEVEPGSDPPVRVNINRNYPPTTDLDRMRELEQEIGNNGAVENLREIISESITKEQSYARMTRRLEKYLKHLRPTEAAQSTVPPPRITCQPLRIAAHASTVQDEHTVLGALPKMDSETDSMYSTHYPTFGGHMDGYQSMDNAMDEAFGTYEVAAYVGQQQDYSGMDQPLIPSYSSNGSQSASLGNGMGLPETVDAFVGTRRALPTGSTGMDPRVPRRRMESARMEQAHFPPAQSRTLASRPPLPPVPPPMAKVPCEFHINGHCRFGNNCNFSHEGHGSGMVEVQMSPSDRQQFLQYVSHRDQRQRQAQELQRSGTRGPYWV